MNKKKEYIQLPPIPRDTDGKTVQMMWEYARLEEKAQQAMNRWYDNSVLSEAVEKDQTERIENISMDILEPFRNSMMELIAQITKETSILAAFVLSECIVLERDVEVVMRENPDLADKIQGMYQLFVSQISS